MVKKYQLTMPADGSRRDESNLERAIFASGSRLHWVLGYDWRWLPLNGASSVDFEHLLWRSRKRKKFQVEGNGLFWKEGGRGRRGRARALRVQTGPLDTSFGMQDKDFLIRRVGH